MICLFILGAFWLLGLWLWWELDRAPEVEDDG